MGVFRFACVAVALLLASTVEAQTISRYAGAGGTTYNGDNPAQTALTANINFPGAAAVDSAGNLYIAEISGHRIRKVTPTGVITTYHGTGTAGSLSTQLNGPYGVAVDAAGNLYIADTGNYRIQKVAAQTMIVTTVAGTGMAGNGADGVATSSGLNGPTGVAVDSAGDLYLSDTQNNRVRKVTFSTGNIATIAGGGPPACSASNLLNPGGVAVAANGDVYFADTGNNKIRKLSGGVLTVAAGGPVAGGCVLGFVDGTADNARFSGPTGVAVMPNGDVLISDPGNRRVRRLRSGSVSTLVGDGVDAATGDNGPATAARLSQAYGIAAGVSGTYAYYIADSFGNHRIRKVVPVAPAAPTLDSATGSSGQASLAFTAPSNDGGAPVTTYNASCTPGPVSQGGASSPIVVTGLSNGTQYTCSVTATNVAGASVASNTLNVTPGIAPSITSAAPGGGTVGVAYTHTYTATGSPAPTFAVTSGALPAGLVLAAGGAVTGTPTTAGLFTGTVTASNNVAPTSPQGFSITVAQGTQAIGFAALPDRTLGTGPFTLSAAGGASGNPVTFATTTTGTCTTIGTNGTTLTLVAAGTCTIAADQAGNANYAAAPQIQRSFTIAVQQPGLALSAPSIDFGGQSMGTTSPARTVTVTNTGQAALTVSALTAPNAQFAYSHDCTNVGASATCTITATFTPAATGAAFNSSTPVSTNLSIASNAAGSPHTLSLAGAAEKSLVTHYYRSILRRDPDSGGKAFWASEADRIAAAGANPNEAWFAMAAAFYSSTEYLALNRTPTGFTTDLYNTFFNRPPDAGGLNYWVGQMASGMPREVVLVSFMFSIEFGNFTGAIFGTSPVRAEIDAVMDFYRGLLSRLPDGGGFTFWVGRFRAAQCQGAAAVAGEAESISSLFTLSAEYAARGRTNSQFVGDLYNAFLRRGGDLGGVLFWISQLDAGAQTREQVRVQFRNSPEFGARVGAIISAGCL